jgi:ubiquinone/menaquinone biosynthesis C-methylase UbiE
VIDATTHHRRVRAFHDRIAGDYERIRYGRPSVTQAANLIRRDLAMRMIASVSGRMLDVGCGPGTYSLQLTREDRRVFAVDVSLNMLREMQQATRRRSLAVGAVNSDLVRLAVRANSIDGVVCIGVLGYVADPRVAMAEIHRVLKPGGFAVVQISNAGSVTEWIEERMLPWIKQRLGIRPAKGYGRDFDVQAYTKRHFDRLVEEQGFELIDWDFYNFHIPLLDRIGASAAIQASRQLQRVSRWRCLRLVACGYLALIRKAASSPDAP